MPLPPFLRWLTASPLTTSAASALEKEQRIAEQINPTAIASSPTQEDWYWGRRAEKKTTTGGVSPIIGMINVHMINRQI